MLLIHLKLSFFCIFYCHWSNIMLSVVAKLKNGCVPSSAIQWRKLLTESKKTITPPPPCCGNYCTVYAITSTLALYCSMYSYIWPNPKSTNIWKKYKHLETVQTFGKSTNIWKKQVSTEWPAGRISLTRPIISRKKATTKYFPLPLGLVTRDYYTLKTFFTNHLHMMHRLNYFGIIA